MERTGERQGSRMKEGSFKEIINKQPERWKGRRKERACKEKRLS